MHTDCMEFQIATCGNGKCWVRFTYPCMEFIVTVMEIGNRHASYINYTVPVPQFQSRPPINLHQARHSANITRHIPAKRQAQAKVPHRHQYDVGLKFNGLLAISPHHLKTYPELHAQDLITPPRKQHMNASHFLHTRFRPSPIILTATTL